MSSEPVFQRRVGHRYEDPLSRIWESCAEAVGYKVVRTDTAYAASDGAGCLLIGNAALLDADDSLAQMILHELCHALVEGEDGEQLPDWGLDNTSGRDTWHEHACLRLQAYLTEGYGLRGFFAPTTDFRVSFWNTLGADPLAAGAIGDYRRERSCVAARQAIWRAGLPRWRAPMHQALHATAMLAQYVPRKLQGADAPPSLPSLWRLVEARPALHPLSHAPVASYFSREGHGCADCAWSKRYAAKTDAVAPRMGCMHAPRRRLAGMLPACQRWEPVSGLDCQQCGACCREAYDVVEVRPHERVMRAHPERIIRKGARYCLTRDQGRCDALKGGETPAQPYHCEIYQDRPKTCRDFTLGSQNCLDARRRIGLSV